MAKIVNLRITRKNRQRDVKRHQADANALKFGRNKAQRERETMEADKNVRHLDGHKKDQEK